MTLTLAQDGNFSGTVIEGTRLLFEEIYLLTGLIYEETFMTPMEGDTRTALFDFLYDIQSVNTETTRDLSYFEEKLKSLLTVAVYAHVITYDPPAIVQGTKSVPMYKIDAVSKWWGFLGTFTLLFSCLIVWWFAVFIGPKQKHLWHYDSRDNSWNYLYAKLDPHMSLEDAMNQNTIYFQDGDANVIKADKVDRHSEQGTGSRV
jgi:hypothetical protein